MLAPRNLLKSNATTFDRLLRVTDPMVIVIVGWVSYLIYLGSAVLPPNYWVALLGAALLGIVVFPETGLYRPKRGASLAEDLHALTYGWSVLVAVGIWSPFSPRPATLIRVSGSPRRQQRACWRTPRCASPCGWRCAGCAGAVTTCGTSASSAPASLRAKSSRACARRHGAD